MRGERGDRLFHPEEADQPRELHEREVRLRVRCFVPRCREQVGLADAVAAVEVAGGAPMLLSSRVRRPHLDAFAGAEIAAVNRSISARAAACDG